MTAEVRGALLLPGRLDGIDVSQVQGVIDWQRVAAAGFRFAIVKASEGVAYCDPRAIANLDGARAAGLVAMAYAFARPSQERPREQVQRLWDCAGDTMPARVVLDLESAPDDWSPTQVADFGEAFADVWREYSALECVVYTYPDFARRRLAPPDRLARCPLWIASYRSTLTPWAPTPADRPPVPSPWVGWSMWQYSGGGGYRVPGVPGDCDRNLFAGGEPELEAFCGFVSPAAETEPQLPEGTAIVHTLDYPMGRDVLDDDE